MDKPPATTPSAAERRKASTAPKWFRSGDPFHGYAILKEIGHGGMSRIFAARHAESRHVVALKVLDPDLTKQERMRQRFLAEGRFGERLEHPAIVEIFDVGHWEGFDYIAMEYVRGRNLQRMLGSPESRLFTPRLSARIIRTVAEALSHAYGRGLVHRDIKLDNIMIDADKAIKLMDFGLALDMRNDRADATSKLGSPNYISPEQARGQAVDFRTDIYSLGVCFYYMVTGRFPFIARDSTALIKMHLEREPRPPIEINPALSEAANRLILRMLAKDRDERHHAYPALLHALDAVINGAGQGKAAASASGGSQATPGASQADNPPGRDTIEIEGRAIEQISRLDAIQIGEMASSSSSDSLALPEVARPAATDPAQGAQPSASLGEGEREGAKTPRGSRPARASAPDPRLTEHAPREVLQTARPVLEPEDEERSEPRNDSAGDSAKERRVVRPGRSRPSSQRLPAPSSAEGDSDQASPSREAPAQESKAANRRGFAQRSRPGRRRRR